MKKRLLTLLVTANRVDNKAREEESDSNTDSDLDHSETAKVESAQSLRLLKVESIPDEKTIRVHVSIVRLACAKTTN